MREDTDKIKRFNYLSSEMDAAYHEASLRLGLSDSVSIILYIVCLEGGECLLSDICRFSGLSKQTIHSAVRKMENEGLISLEIYQGRKKNVRLTKEGEALAEKTVFRLVRLENEILDSWTKEEVDQYLALTQKYLDMFREKVKEL